MNPSILTRRASRSPSDAIHYCEAPGSPEVININGELLENQGSPDLLPDHAGFRRVSSNNRIEPSAAANGRESRIGSTAVQPISWGNRQQWVEPGHPRTGASDQFHDQAQFPSGGSELAHHLVKIAQQIARAMVGRCFVSELS